MQLYGLDAVHHVEEAAFVADRRGRFSEVEQELRITAGAAGLDPRDPTFDERGLPVREAEVGAPKQQQRVVLATGAEPVFHRLGHMIVLLAPPGARDVDGVDSLRSSGAELGAEHVAELRLVGVPRVIPVDRTSERVLPFQPA